MFNTWCTEQKRNKTVTSTTKYKHVCETWGHTYTACTICSLSLRSMMPTARGLRSPMSMSTQDPTVTHPSLSATHWRSHRNPLALLYAGRRTKKSCECSLCVLVSIRWGEDVCITLFAMWTVKESKGTVSWCVQYIHQNIPSCTVYCNILPLNYVTNYE